jgi:hypothetical protein
VGTCFVPYQIDYSEKNVAKSIGFSKKCINFKFGLADLSACGINSDGTRLESSSEQQTGPACRGSEHDVTFLWSLKSGKRQLLLDGIVLHYSESNLNGWTQDREWQFAFPVRDRTSGLVFRAHFLSQPVRSDVPNMKPYELRLAGCSYFHFNPIFALGTSQQMVHRVPPKGVPVDGTPFYRSTPGSGQRAYNDYKHSSISEYGSGGSPDRRGNDAYLRAEEKRMIQMAKEASLREFYEKQAKQQTTATAAETTPAPAPAKMKREEESLLSFDDDTAPVAPAAYGTQQQFPYNPVPPTLSYPPPQQPLGMPTTSSGGGHFTSSLTLDPALTSGYGSSFPSQQPSYQPPPSTALVPTAAPSNPASYYASALQYTPAPGAAYGAAAAPATSGYGAAPSTNTAYGTAAAPSTSTALTPFTSSAPSPYPGAPPPPQQSFDPSWQAPQQPLQSPSYQQPQQPPQAAYPWGATSTTSGAPPPLASPSSQLQQPSMGQWGAAPSGTAPDYNAQPPLASPSAQSYASYGSAATAGAQPSAFSFASPPPPAAPLAVAPPVAPMFTATAATSMAPSISATNSFDSNPFSSPPMGGGNFMAPAPPQQYNNPFEAGNAPYGSSTLGGPTAAAPPPAGYTQATPPFPPQQQQQQQPFAGSYTQATYY